MKDIYYTPDGEDYYTPDGEDYLVRIEYKAYAGQFHFEMPDEDNRQTFGWATVYPTIGSVSV